MTDYTLTAELGRERGISHIRCDGDEASLGDCEVGGLTSQPCSRIATAHCLDGI